MCLLRSARTVAIVFARSAGSEAMYCAGVLTFDGGFMDSSSYRTKFIIERAKNQSAPAALCVSHFETHSYRSVNGVRVQKRRIGRGPTCWGPWRVVVHREGGLPRTLL